MAETPKLSVGQALEKLLGPDAPEPRRAQLDAKIGELDAEILRLKATRSRVERDQRAGAARGDLGEATEARGANQGMRWIMVATGLAVAMLIATLAWKLF